MRELVMKVTHFFKIDRRGIIYTVLGGVVECDKLQDGEDVEIVCPGDGVITGICGIQSYSKELEEATKGQTVGLVFSALHHMVFRVTEPVINPYSPKDNLASYLKWDSQENEAEEVFIFRR